MKIIHGSLILLFIAGASCSQQETSDEEAATIKNGRSLVLSADQQRAAGITLGGVTQRKLAAVTRVTGKVEVPPQNIVSVGAPMAGFLRETALLPGTQVKKGERIAIMEDQQYLTIQEEYLKAKVALSAAEPEYRRQKLLADSSASSRAVMERSEANYQSLLVTTNALAERLRMLNIDPLTLNPEGLSPRVSLLSPINGIVVKMNTNRGAHLQIGEILFEMIDPGDLHLVLRVFERDLRFITAGQKVRASSATDPKQQIMAEVILINPFISSDRTAEVHCHFTEANVRIIPGTIMNAEIVSAEKPVASLPKEAVVGYESSHYVFLKQNGRFLMQPVNIGVTDSLWTQIEKPVLNASDTVVISGAYTLLMTLKNARDE